MAVDTWATAAQVKDLFAQVSGRIGASTVIDDDSVTAAIESVSADLTGLVTGLGYTVAGIVADENAAAWMQGTCEYGAVAEMLMRISGGGANRVSDLADRRQQMYEDRVRRLERGNIKLGSLDSDRESQDDSPTSLIPDGTDEIPLAFTTDTSFG